MKVIPEFAVYRGDDFITLGTANECAKQLGVTAQSIKFYASPTYKNRNKDGGNSLVVIRLEDEEE